MSLRNLSYEIVCEKEDDPIWHPKYFQMFPLKVQAK